MSTPSLDPNTNDSGNPPPDRTLFVNKEAIEAAKEYAEQQAQAQAQAPAGPKNYSKLFDINSNSGKEFEVANNSARAKFGKRGGKRTKKRKTKKSKRNNRRKTHSRK